MNGINYQFTQEEIEAIAILVRFARERGGEHGKIVSKIVAEAINRNGLNMLNQNE